MKFQPNLSSIQVPLTQAYLVFRPYSLVVKKICETAKLLTLEYSVIDNKIQLTLVGVWVEVKVLGAVSIVLFSSSQSDQKSKYIKSVIVKSLCTIQK